MRPTTKAQHQARRVSARARRQARRVDRDARKVVANTWLERLARLGYVVRGVLYGVMGVLALELAFGLGASPGDQRKSLYLLAGNPLGGILMVVVVLALAAYSLWGFVRAIYDPLGRGNDPPGIISRLGFAWSGLNYAALMVFALEFLIGATKGDGSDTLQKLVADVMSKPAGQYITIGAGAIGVIAGLGQFADAYQASFRKDLKRNQMNRAERITADALGRFGMVARGVVFTMLGYFVLQAGLHHDPSRAGSMGEAFLAIATAPHGHLVLGLVALGFVALGMHSFANARWVRMPRGKA
jgi:hypothetical protein